MEFDRALSETLYALLKILPADAADEGVWSFLTLSVMPDVALWRYPSTGRDGDHEKYERWLGKPRNVLRRAWWRAYVLGPDLSAQLLEDEAVGIMERPSIGGHKGLARLVVRTHLNVVASGRAGSRQDLLREAAKRLRRRMGVVSVYALPHPEMQRLVDDVFDEAMNALDMARTHAGSMVDADPVDRFEQLVPELWHLLSEHAIDVPWYRMQELSVELDGYRAANADHLMTAGRIAEDLESLIADWASMSPAEHAVVHSAANYFLLAADQIPDDLPLGLDDDDRVVGAAYEALDRVRTDRAV